MHLTPRASKESLGGTHGQAVKVRVKAPPVDNRANEALIKFMARTLGLRPGDVHLVSGQTNRTKVLAVDGLTPEETAARLGLD